jgi:Ulp1 family protease
MIDNDLPNLFMPDCNNIFTHFPSDALSSKINSCLTGTIMNTFLTCMTLNVADGTCDNSINVLNTSFYAQLVNTLHIDINCPGWNTSNYDGVTEYTSHYTRADILKTTIIPIHIPGHWLICIIDPSMKTL